MYTCTDTHAETYTCISCVPHIQMHMHTHACTHADTHHTHSQCSSISSPTCTPSLPPNFMAPSPFLPTYPHSLQNMSCPAYLHTFLCVQSPDTLWGRRERGKMGGRETEERGGKIRKKRKKKDEGERKKKGEEWRIEWLTSACKANFPWPDGFSAHVTFVLINLTPLKLMA